VLNTVARVGKVLKLFTPERPEWGVTQVAAALELPKSNAHEMLASLASIGFLERLPHGRYRLGWRLLTMSRNLVEADGFKRQADRIVGAMAHRLGEAAAVAAWDGRYIVCVTSNGSASGVTLPERSPGVRMPGHSTSLGKVLLAHRPWEQVEELATVDGLPAFTDHTVATVDDLRRQLDDARRHAVAFDHEENHDGVSCVAAPVRDASSRVVAALSISMATDKLRRAEPQYARAVGVAAHRLSALLSESSNAAAAAA